MMNATDVLLITFSATAANHLGLVAAVEKVIRLRLHILNCPRCAAFWSVIVYGVVVAARPLDACTARFFSPFTLHSSLQIIATAFLSSWSAIWLDLMMGIIDQLYTKLYDKIYSTTDTPDADTPGADNTLSDVSE